MSEGVICMRCYQLELQLKSCREHERSGTHPVHSVQVLPVSTSVQQRGTYANSLSGTSSRVGHVLTKRECVCGSCSDVIVFWLRYRSNALEHKYAC